MLDLDDRVMLTEYHQAGEFGLRPGPPVSGTFPTSRPFPVRIDLDALLR